MLFWLPWLLSDQVFGAFTFSLAQFIPQGPCWFNKLVNLQLQTDNKAPLCCGLALLSLSLSLFTVCLSLSLSLSKGCSGFVCRLEHEGGEERWEGEKIDYESDLEAFVCSSLLRTTFSFFFFSFFFFAVCVDVGLPAEKVPMGSSASPSEMLDLF